MNKPVSYGSVCSGIEAASVAWHCLSWQPAWFAEIEKFPSAVLAYRWPDVSNLGDMTQIAAAIRAGKIEAPDVLVGGTPCQAFSVAGLRNGLADERGQLTLAFVELVNAIDEKRREQGKPPVIVVWENVPGVFSSKDNAFGCFLAGHAGESCALESPGKRWSNAGYVLGPERAIAWRVLDAQFFGVAQRRRRVFVVATARGDIDPAKILFESEGLRRNSPPSRKTPEEIAQIISGSIANGSHWDGEHNPHPTLNQSFNTGGIGASNQEIFSQRGSGLVGAIAAHSFTGGAGGRPDGAAAGHFIPVVTQYESECAGTITARHDSSPCADRGMNIITMAHGQGGAEVKTDNSSPTLTCNHEAPIAAYSIPGNWIGRASQNGGNSTEPPHQISPCLTATDHHGVAYSFKAGQGAKAHGIGYACEQAPTLTSANSGSNQAPAIMQNMAVRRLTPVECERLQGFPDNHTLIPTQKLKQLTAEEYAYLRHHRPELTAEQAYRQAADGPRYKAIGNSMAVPVMRWIGSRIQEALRA
ncbi:DNA cytosine methyltransferase [Enterobacter asburiae]|nr:DNA cytosine methyltransferase [Enterobacter asburiae]